MGTPEDASGDGSGIRVERDDAGVVRLTLSRPAKKNAIHGPMWTALAEVLAEVADRPEDRVLVVSGAGDAFCAGADLTEPVDGRTMDDLDPGQALRQMRRVGQVVRLLHELPKPTLALVDGVAVGAGAGIALACDLVLAGPKARLSIIFSARGLSLDAGTSWLLPRLVGLQRAKELAFFGDMLDAETMHRLGLANRVFDDADTLRRTGDAWAHRLAQGAPIQLSLTKCLLHESSDRTLAQAVEAEAAAQTISLGTRDLREALAAFVEKRSPRYEGR